jgi:hypothetical protein
MWCGKKNVVTYATVSLSFIIINGSTAHYWALAAIFSFWTLYTVSRTPWTGDQPVVRPLHTGQHTRKHRINMHRDPYLEWDSNRRSQKKAHASDCKATVVGRYCISSRFTYSYAGGKGRQAWGGGGFGHFQAFELNFLIYAYSYRNT